MTFYRKTVLSLCFLGLLSTQAFAGIKLEKDVPLKSLTGAPRELKFKIYDSETSDTPITSQKFPSGQWEADYDFTKYLNTPQEIVRFRGDFKNTQALSLDMTLWLEIEVDGVVKGHKEKIKKDVWSLFAEHAGFAEASKQAAICNNADMVDGMHSSELEESKEIDNKIAAHSLIPDAHHKKTTSFKELTDSASDAQIPDDITVNHAATAKEADTLDGKHASELQTPGAPTGYCILGFSPIPPAGYTYTGRFCDTYANENRWTFEAPMPTKLSGAGVAVLDSKIYVIGGGYDSYTPLNQVYDSSTGTWTTKAPMPTERATLSLAVLNGKIYAIGGFKYDGSNRIFATNEMYDPVTDTWTTKAPMLNARRIFSAVALNGKIYAIGGSSDIYGSSPVRDIEEYDPATDTWTVKTSLPEEIKFTYVGAVVVNAAKIYVIRAESDSFNFAYEPVSNTWEAKTPLSGSHGAFCSAVINDKIYVIGGSNGNVSLDEYDTAANIWTNKPSMPVSLDGYSGGAVALNGKIHVIGAMLGNVHEVFDPSSIRYYIHQKDF